MTVAVAVAVTVAVKCDREINFMLTLILPLQKYNT